MRKFKKIKWKRGSSLLEFAIALPCICIILFSIIIIGQMLLCRQSLEHTVYLAGRAAVVCESYDEAVYQMNSVALSTIEESVFGIDDGEGVTTSLRLVAGTSGVGGAPSTVNGITWEKGALAEIKITVPLTKALRIGPDTMTSTIYIMVERPAPTFM